MKGREIRISRDRARAAVTRYGRDDSATVSVEGRQIRECALAAYRSQTGLPRSIWLGLVNAPVPRTQRANLSKLQFPAEPIRAPPIRAGASADRAAAQRAVARGLPAGGQGENAKDQGNLQRMGFMWTPDFMRIRLARLYARASNNVDAL